MENQPPCQTVLPRYPWIGKKPFHGWVIVAVGVITQFIQGISSQGFSTYLGYFQHEFGWSKALVAGPRSVSSIEGAVIGPLEGFLVDKFGPQLMVRLGVFIMGLGFILFGFTDSLWMYFLSNVVISLGLGFLGLLIMSVTINNWFRRKRTLAQSIMLLGYSMAGVVGIPLLVLSQSSFGWRASAIGTGIIIWIVGFPCSFLLRTRPEHCGLLPDGDPPGGTTSAGTPVRAIKTEYDFTLRQAIRTRAFWFLSFGTALGGMGMGAAQVHLFLHLEQGVGLSATTSAFVWTVASLTNIPFRLVGGVLGDRLPKNLMMAAATFLLALSMVFLGLAKSIQIAMVFAVLYGIGWGIRTPIMNAIQADYWGRKSMGVIFGWSQSISLPFSITAPILAGYIADVQGDYRLVFVSSCFIMLVGAVIIALAFRPKIPISAGIQSLRRLIFRI